MTEATQRITDEEALALHALYPPGKLEINPTKPLISQRDLSLAYSPGVAAPCMEIFREPSRVYDFTSKSNMVAVISNGTAVLGLGDLGALASKPVMEGKAVLFKRFADVDGIDLCVDTRDVDEFVNSIRYLAPSFGGINLEDIKAPDCFMIEQRLSELMNIPVFHDDQHGTAIIAAAALINALYLTGREIGGTRIVINGAGAAAIACADLFSSMGVSRDKLILCDTKGVVWRGRTEGINQWKSAHACETSARSLAEALVGADVFIGLSVKGAVTQDMIQTMARSPIVFALANPDPEITPEEVRAVRSDAIIATGRSDYPNQVNNVLGFPYIFRGALDVRATRINEPMKIAAARAIAELAREDVPDEVDRAYAGRRLRFGTEYIIPVPFDPRLIERVPAEVAAAAMQSGVAQVPVANMDAYRRSLRSRLDPTAGTLERIFDRVRSTQRRIILAEGEEDRAIRAAVVLRDGGHGHPVLIGREDVVRARLKALDLPDSDNLEIYNARVASQDQRYISHLYNKLQRHGYLLRDCQRLVHQDRNVFAALMVALGDADALVTGLTRSFTTALESIRLAIDPLPRHPLFGLSILTLRGRTLLLADTSVHEVPTGPVLADIALAAATRARALGQEPRVAFLSQSNFGQPLRDSAANMREAIRLLDARGSVGFEYDGEMAADVALDHRLMRQLYPFSRLTGPANVLLMPTLQAADIGVKLLQAAGATLTGPLLVGMSKPVQIVALGATVGEVVTAAALAASETAITGLDG